MEDNTNNNQTRLGLSPQITVSNAAAAIEFYKKAFGATELMRHTVPNSPKIMHATVEIKGSMVMLNDDFPEFCGGQSRTPEALGGSPVVLHLQVEDAEKVFAEATAAGAQVIMPLADQFWGDKYGQLKDPFGLTWSVGQTVRVVSEQEMQQAAEQMFSQGA